MLAGLRFAEQGEKMLENNTKIFVQTIRNRSIENKKSITLLLDNQLFGNSFSIIRQELDSMIRVIYLLNVVDLDQREDLINQTLSGQKWKIQNENGKIISITDRDMVELANSLFGWTKSVYKFGCAFIHLSDFHNYLVSDPFQKLSYEDRKDIIKHVNNYHMTSLSSDCSIQEFYPLIMAIFDKVSENLGCYLDDLEKNKIGTD
jgi:hypothetical protein